MTHHRRHRESWASDSTILSIAGHVSRRMLEGYGHIRMEAQRNALAAISRSQVSHGTGNGTKTGAEVENVPNLGIKMIGACGFEQHIQRLDSVWQEAFNHVL